MAANLAFGRPSAHAVWAEGPVVLGRVTVAAGVSPLPEPIIHRDGPIATTADLRLPGSPTDAAAHDAALHAFRSGTFPSALDGDFAVAIWDGRHNELTLARDRLGIRPLFLARTSGGLAFASFPDALIDAGIVDGRFLPEDLVELYLGALPVSSGTWICGVERLPAGHVMTIGPQGPRLRQYWRYPVGWRARELGPVPDNHATAAKALRSALESAIRRALPSHAAVATLLSGGLDSGAIAALAANLAGRPAAEVTAYCVTMPESNHQLGAIDEEPTAQAVARRAGLTLVTYPYDMVRDCLLRPLARTFLTLDNPDHAYDRILADAAARGADRILCGFGGDEVVSYNGEGALLADFLTLRWGALRRTARELSQPLWRGLARQAATVLPPGLERRLRQAAGRANPYEPLRTGAFRPGFRPSRRWMPVIGPHRIQRARLANAALHHRLEYQAWQAARHGLRYVFPMLDWRLVEFGAGLPARLQLHNGMRRALLRTAVADLLPPEILERPTKLAPSPTVLYDLAANREALIAEARRVSASPAASAVVDLAEVERQLAALPEAEAVAEALRDEAARGLQLRDPRTAVITPFLLARALAQNEAACAGRSSFRPEAA